MALLQSSKRLLWVLWGMAAQLANIIPEASGRFAFRRFWGEAVLSGRSYFVIDAFENVKLKNEFRWADSGADEECFGGGAAKIIDGAFAPQAAAMLTSLFLRYGAPQLRVTADTELAQGTEDETLICYGSSDSNFKTFEVEAWSGSNLCQLLLNDQGDRAFRVGGRLFSIERRDDVVYDKAVLLRFAKQPGANCSHVVCAGLSEWGSLAAVHYLTTHWNHFHGRFDRFGRRRDFCIVLEVPCGQFENAREIISAVRWDNSPIPCTDLVPSPFTKLAAVRSRR